MRLNKAFFVLLTIGVVCVMVVCLFYLSKRRSDSIQNQIQSTERVRVYAGKTSLNDSLTSNISEIWFSDEMTDGRVDIERACARYGMTDAEIREFSEHYSDYAVINIPLKIVNLSDVTIGGFHLSFKNINEKKVMWLYSGNIGGFYNSAESGDVENEIAQALVNLTDCPIEMINETVQNNGLQLLFDFTPKHGQMNQKTIEVIF